MTVIHLQRGLTKLIIRLIFIYKLIWICVPTEVIKAALLFTIDSRMHFQPPLSTNYLTKFLKKMTHSNTSTPIGKFKDGGGAKGATPHKCDFYHPWY